MNIPVINLSTDCSIDEDSPPIVGSRAAFSEICMRDTSPYRGSDPMIFPTSWVFL
jgi:hypothetical protein